MATIFVLRLISNSREGNNEPSSSSISLCFSASWCCYCCCCCCKDWSMELNIDIMLISLLWMLYCVNNKAVTVANDIAWDPRQPKTELICLPQSSTSFFRWCCLPYELWLWNKNCCIISNGIMHGILITVFTFLSNNPVINMKIMPCIPISCSIDDCVWL
jgi:hypothetical protein